MNNTQRSCAAPSWGGAILALIDELSVVDRFRHTVRQCHSRFSIGPESGDLLECSPLRFRNDNCHQHDCKERSGTETPERAIRSQVLLHYWKELSAGIADKP